MADITLDFGFKDLDKAQKALKDLKKAADDLRKGIKGTGTIMEQDAVHAKKLAKASKAVNVEKRKLNNVDNERIKISKQLQNVNAKIALANSKEARTLAAKQKQLREINTQLRTGGKNTNSWGKALGSFQFKFNSLGNIAANVLSSMTRMLKSAVNQFTSLEKIMRSTQISSDAFDRSIGRMKGAFEALNRAIAMGDLSKIGSIMKQAADAAEDYIRALDTLGDTQNAIDIQSAKTRLEVSKLQETYNDVSQSDQDRMDAALKAQTLLRSVQEKQEKSSKDDYDNAYQRIQGSFKLSDEQLDVYKRFIENYNLLTDDQVTALQDVETAQADAKKGSFSLAQGFALAAGASGEVLKEYVDGQEALTEYENVAKSMSDTLGFDVLPIMEAIAGTGDTVRTKVTEVTVAYYDNQRVMQRLINSTAAVVGSVKNSIEAKKSEIKKVEDSTKAVDDNTEALGYNKTAFDALMKSKHDAVGTVGIVPIETGGEDETKRQKKELDEKLQLEAEHLAMIDRLRKDSAQKAAALAYGLSNLIMSQKNKELAAAGDDAKKKEAIEIKYAKKAQQIAMIEAVVHTAVGVARAFRDYALPYALIPAALAAALGGVQVATIANQQFAEGGPINGDPHSRGGVNIEAEGGEYIINKRSTSKYKGLIDAINQDDQVRIMDAMSRDKKITVNQSDEYTHKMYDLMKLQVQYGEDNEFYYKHKGNMLIKTRKN